MGCVCVCKNMWSYLYKLNEIEHTSGLTTNRGIPCLSLRQLLGQLSLQFHDLRLLRGHGQLEISCAIKWWAELIAKLSSKLNKSWKQIYIPTQAFPYFVVVYNTWQATNWIRIHAMEGRNKLVTFVRPKCLCGETSQPNSCKKENSAVFVCNGGSIQNQTTN